MINNGNKENQGQFGEFLKNIIYQNGLTTGKNNDHKRNSSLANQGYGGGGNGNNLGVEKNKASSLRKLQLPMINKKEVGNKL